MDFQLPISRAKITPTPVREATLSRARLLGWLRSNIGRRALLVVAEAGYGKTTLLADFSRQGHARCIWYQLDSSDCDWVTFTAYLVAAIREVHAGFGAGTAGLLERMAVASPSRDTVLATLAAEVSELQAAPTMLILDDFHNVESSEDVREILARLMQHAPVGWCFVLAARRSPELPLGRLAAQGHLAELGTQDLRFSRAETELLFSEAYGQPLDAELLDLVDARTEGWIASLQLVYSSIRDRSPLEIRSFIDSLSGAHGHLYEFLGQELLRDLPVPMRRFLTHAALLDRVSPRHVEAMLTAEPNAPSIEQIVALMIEAESMGLLSSAGDDGAGRRFHPLLRDFLLRQLAESMTEGELRELHRRIASSAEGHDWLTASHHYLEAGAPREAMRVLGASALVALGSGHWGPAGVLIERLQEHNPDPQVLVLGAVRDIYRGETQRGLSMLDLVETADPTPVTRALARHARYRALWSLGQEDAIDEIVREAMADPATPDVFRDIAEMHDLTYRLQKTLDLAGAAQRLARLAARQADTGLPYFAGISWHNAMDVEFHRASYEQAAAYGDQALASFRQTATELNEAPSTHALLARVCSELGLVSRGNDHLRLATREAIEHPVASSEAAYLCAVVGALEEAEGLFTRAQRMAPKRGGSDQWTIEAARVRLLLSQGHPHAALRESLRATTPRGIGADVAWVSLRAYAAAVAQDESAPTLLAEAIHSAEETGARHWAVRLQIAQAALGTSGEELARRIREGASVGEGALLECAEVIVAALHLLSATPRELAWSLERHPIRWRDVLRRQLGSGLTPSGKAAIPLLATVGDVSDAPRIRAYERTYLRRVKGPGLAKLVARRASPPLTVHDLGRTRFEVGDRRADVTTMRRKAAALLLFLVSRRSGVATKEQVMDALWPESNPAAAANSLNQTLYFLRRDIDPWYDDETSMDYVHMEGEMIWLDDELVRSDSASFLTAAEAQAESADLTSIQAAVRLYGGRFAPEFEYEDWASGPRERLHAVYLEMVHRLQQRLAAANRLGEAAALTRDALAIDPDALEVERDLIWLYSSMGARAAAAEQYSHYAEAHRDQVGAEPPSLAEIAAQT